MWTKLCGRAATLHATGPFSNERAKYLSFCLDRGESRTAVQGKACELLWMASRIRETHVSLHLTGEEIRAIARTRRVRGHRRATRRTRRHCEIVACAWLRFLGCLKQPRVPFEKHLRAYCDWAREERGLSELTIAGVYRHTKNFFLWFGALGRRLFALRIDDIDTYFVRATAEHGWSRISVRVVTYSLRQFFKFAEAEGLIRKGLASLIVGP
jgi:hypothetical protein